MKEFECPYFDECGLLCNQTNENCRIKELFEDFYKVEKLYIEANTKCEQLEQENEKLEEKLKEVQKFLERHEVGECDWDDDCYYCKNASKDGKYYCNIGNALEVIRGKR